MNRKARCLFAILAILAVPLACHMPVELATPLPSTSAPTQTQPGPVVSIPSATPPPTLAPDLPSATLPPTATVILPTNTAVPPTATATATGTSTATVTLTFTPTVSSTPTKKNSPTPPPTLTKAPATATPAAPSRLSFTAPYFSNPPVLDGVWNEWKDSTTEYPLQAVVYGGANWSGEDDLQASFRVGWDTNYLYLAVKVRDDQYVQNASGNNLYLGDSLEVLLDANLFGDLYSDALSGDDYQLGISPGSPDTDGAKEAFLWFPRGKAGERSGVKIASVRQDGVTRIEAAVPWSLFGVAPSAGDRFGFAVSVSDNDTPSDNAQESMISSAAGRVLVDPTTWNQLKLK